MYPLPSGESYHMTSCVAGTPSFLCNEAGGADSRATEINSVVIDIMIAGYHFIPPESAGVSVWVGSVGNYA